MRGKESERLGDGGGVTEKERPMRCPVPRCLFREMDREEGGVCVCLCVCGGGGGLR